MQQQQPATAEQWQAAIVSCKVKGLGKATAKGIVDHFTPQGLQELCQKSKSEMVEALKECPRALPHAWACHRAIPYDR